jgi:Uma2 family endonuclease
MSTTTLPPRSHTTPESGPVLTAADLARLPRTLVTTDVDYELHDGRLVIMAPPGDLHADQQARFAAYLFLRGQQHGHGAARGEVGILLRRNPDHLVGADAAFLSSEQLPPQISPEGYLLTVPSLIVEIRSKSNTQDELDTKVRDYLAAGAVLVWVADPESRTVIAHRPDQPPLVFTATDSLTADGVIPGFAVPVAELLPET